MAVPVRWDELEHLDRANGFDVFAAAARAQEADSWEGYFDTEQVLSLGVQDVVKR